MWGFVRWLKMAENTRFPSANPTIQDEISTWKNDLNVVSDLMQEVNRVMSKIEPRRGTLTEQQVSIC